MGVPPAGGWGLYVKPPDGGWPELDEAEVERLEQIAVTVGGHPQLIQQDGINVGYMNFEGKEFAANVDFSELTLVGANFRRSVVIGDGEETVRFSGARFFAPAHFTGARFDVDVEFAKTHFTDSAHFGDVDFNGEAEFQRTIFEQRVIFDRATFADRALFRETAFLASPSPEYFEDETGIHIDWFSQMECLVSFIDVEFGDVALFPGAQFGGTAELGGEPRRWVDFSGSKFQSQTSFTDAIFAGPPGFFETQLHKDTDFHDVTWRDPAEPYTSYNIRAWEQLELIMSELEKPRDRHRFFRKRMRALRHQPGNRLLTTLNWLFEKIADYGWGAKQAALSWLIHWLGGGLVLLLASAPFTDSPARLVLPAIATSFSNAHAFLGLTSENGYLEAYRDVTEASLDQWVMQLVGTGQAVLGPILLFLLLLTLRNRFRLG